MNKEYQPKQGIFLDGINNFGSAMSVIGDPVEFSSYINLWYPLDNNIESSPHKMILSLISLFPVNQLIEALKSKNVSFDPDQSIYDPDSFYLRNPKLHYLKVLSFGQNKTKIPYATKK